MESIQNGGPGGVGEIVRRRRLDLGATLQAIAERVGCARSYLSAIENGTGGRRERPPSDELLSRLEGALGLDPGALIEPARWQRTPEPVRAAMAHLESRGRASGDAANALGAMLAGSGMDDQGRIRGALDAAYRTGELRRIVDLLAPPPGATLPSLSPEPCGQSRPKGASPEDGAVRALRSLMPIQVPLINKVAAGSPAPFTDLGYPARVADEYVRAPDVGDADAFAARVCGDSMLPEYREGDVVVFSPSRAVASGMDCFARLEPDHESTFKRVYFETDPGGGDVIRLQPLNPAYAARVVARERVAGLYAAVSVTRVLAPAMG